MRISNKGFDLIKKSESLRLKTYLDSGGVPTIGYGHTKDVKMGDMITEPQAQVFLQADAWGAEEAVNSLVKITLNQNQFDALVDFVFNLGEDNFHTSTLLKRLNMGDYTGAADQFQVWNKDIYYIKDAKGNRVRVVRELPGLTKRRKAEKDLFVSLEN